jgi:hypothetical protein
MPKYLSTTARSNRPLTIRPEVTDKYNVQELIDRFRTGRDRSASCVTKCWCCCVKATEHSAMLLISETCYTHWLSAEMVI